MEITLLTKPLTYAHDPEGEIALCTLSAFNLGAIEDLAEFETLAPLAVRALDNLLDYQDYPMPAAQQGTDSRRSLGVGINLAYYIAKHGKKYSDGSANTLVHQTFEAMQYALLKASNALAQEKGARAAFADTTYAQGLLPIDTYKKDLDAVCAEPLQCDWEQLCRYSTVWFKKLNAIVVNAIRNLFTNVQCDQWHRATTWLGQVKASKDGILKQVVPDIDTLRHTYEKLWDMPDNTGYLQLVGIMQKFVDQSISTNTAYDPSRFADSKVPMQVLLKDLLLAYKLGVKTLYYHNTRDGASDAQDAPEKEDDSQQAALVKFKLFHHVQRRCFCNMYVRRIIIMQYSVFDQTQTILSKNLCFLTAC